MQLDAKPEDVMEMHKSYLRLEFRHTAAKILEEYKSQPKSLLRLLLVVKRSKLGLEGGAGALKSKDDILNAKKELAAINVQIGQKMNEYASLVLGESPMLGRILQGFREALFVMVLTTTIVDHPRNGVRDSHLLRQYPEEMV